MCFIRLDMSLSSRIDKLIQVNSHKSQKIPITVFIDSQIQCNFKYTLAKLIIEYLPSSSQQKEVSLTWFTYFQIIAIKKRINKIIQNNVKTIKTIIQKQFNLGLDAADSGAFCSMLIWVCLSRFSRSCRSRFQKSV